MRYSWSVDNHCRRSVRLDRFEMNSGTAGIVVPVHQVVQRLDQSPCDSLKGARPWACLTRTDRLAGERGEPIEIIRLRLMALACQPPARGRAAQRPSVPAQLIANRIAEPLLFLVHRSAERLLEALALRDVLGNARKRSAPAPGPRARAGNDP